MIELTTKITPREYKINNGVVYSIITNSAVTINGENIDDIVFESIPITIYNEDLAGEDEFLNYYLDKLIEDGDTYDEETKEFHPMESSGFVNYKSKYKQMILDEIGKKGVTSTTLPLKGLKNSYPTYVFKDLTSASTVAYNGKMRRVKTTSLASDFQIDDDAMKDALKDGVINSYKEVIAKKLRTLDNSVFSGITANNINITIN